MRSVDDDDEDGDGDGDEDEDGDGDSTGNDKSSVVRHSSQFIIYECVDMELFLVFIMATLLRAARGGAGGDGGLRRTWGLGIALSLSPSMSANFQITCDQERPLSLPERLANICLISEMTDLTVDQARLPASPCPLLSLYLSHFLSLFFSLSQHCRRRQTVRLTKDTLLCALYSF